MKRILMCGVLGVSLIAVSALAQAPEPLKHPDSTAGWDDLFAPDLSNAIFPAGVWSFTNGELTATEDQAIWTKADFENFELDLEFKNVEASNSGVFLYCSDLENWVTSCIEVQILDDYADKWKDVPACWKCGGIFGGWRPRRKPSSMPGNGTTIRSAVWGRRWMSC